MIASAWRRPAHLSAVVAIVIAALSITSRVGATSPPNVHTGRRVAMSDLADVPEYLQRWPGLYVRDGDRIVEAPAEDQAVARGYPGWPDKGPLLDGNRLTVLTKKDAYAVDEEVRVIHVVEVVEPGRNVYIMGPKPVFGEYVDDQLATEPPIAGEDPLVPLTYNGRVLPSPAVDYNYEITSYVFSEPGTHLIYWKFDSLQSNVLTITIQ